MSADSVPNGWTRVRFGDVASRVTESLKPTPEQSRFYIGLEHMRSDSYTITDWGSDVDLDVTKTPVLQGDVLFARRNTHLRRCAVAPFDTIFSPDGYAIRTKNPAILLQGFLLYVVASKGFMDFAVENSAGTHSKRVKWSSLERYEFALPPIAEQQQIVRLLETCDANRLAVESAMHEAEKLTISLITERAWRSNRPIDPIQKVWAGAIFFDGDWIESRDQATEGVRLLQLADIGSGRFLNKSARFVSPETFDRLRCTEVKPGDFLISRMADPIGRTCVVPHLGSRLMTAVDVCVVRAPEVRPEEAAYWLAVLNSPQWTRACERAAGGTTRTRVSRSKLERIGVPNIPQAERAEIGKRVLSIETLRESLRLKESACRALVSATREESLRGDRDVH